MSLLRLYNLFFFLFAVYFIGAAQSSCLYFKNMEVESDIWEEGQAVITSFSKDGTDSVLWIENGQAFGAFLAKDDRIISPAIILRDQQGRIRSIDSVRTSALNGSFENYFGYIAVLVVKWEYGLNGIPSKMTLKNQQGKDSLIREWDLHGVLQKESLEGAYPQTCYYYPNGVLKSVTKDLLINHYHVKRVRNYSESGIIQKESWFRNDVPCANWFVYDKKGVLIKTIKHVPLPVKPPVPQAAEIEAPVLMLVNESADPVGGQRAFYGYLESKLNQDLCKRNFSGETYVLRFEIEKDGTCVYKSLQGPRVFEIESFFKAAIEASPRWVPSKKQGNSIREAISLSVRIGL